MRSQSLLNQGVTSIKGWLVQPDKALTASQSLLKQGE